MRLCVDTSLKRTRKDAGVLLAAHKPEARAKDAAGPSLALQACVQRSSQPQTALVLLAVVTLGLWPAAAEAAVLSFRNDTDSPITIRGISIVNRVALQGKVHILRPREIWPEPIFVPGTILIIVADANQPMRILCQQAIQFRGTDLFYAIQPETPVKPKEKDNNSPKSKTPRAVTPKVKLVPIRPTPPALSPASLPRP